MLSLKEHFYNITQIYQWSKISEINVLIIYISRTIHSLSDSEEMLHKDVI